MLLPRPTLDLHFTVPSVVVTLSQEPPPLTMSSQVLGVHSPLMHLFWGDLAYIPLHLPLEVSCQHLGQRALWTCGAKAGGRRESWSGTGCPGALSRTLVSSPEIEGVT